MAETPAPDRPACEPAPDGLLPPELRAWMQLLAAAGVIEQQLRSLVKDRFGVTHDDFLVLCLLADRPGNTLRMTQIAELLGRPKTRLTYQVVCLQHAGLVARHAARGDRRGVEIALTDKARQLLAETAPALTAAVNGALTHTLSCTQREALRGLLPHLPDPADSGPGQPSAGQPSAGQPSAG